MWNRRTACTVICRCLRHPAALPAARHLEELRAVCNPKAPGGVEFVPELVHNRSGMGSHVALVDLNKDGAVDIITSTVRGTFIFWNNRGARASR